MASHTTQAFFMISYTYSFVLPVGRSALAWLPSFIIVQELTQRVAKALPPLIVKTFPHVTVGTHLHQKTQRLLNA